MSYIDDIFNNAVQTADYAKCSHDANVDAECNKLMEVLITPLYSLDRDLGAVAENMCMSYAAASEKFGFAMGFRHAMRLLHECGMA